MDFLVKFWSKAASLDLMAAATVIAVTGTTLFGNQFWAMFFLSVALVAVDTLTRWTYICKSFIVASGRTDSIRNTKLRSAIWQFFKAETWNEDYLNSKGLSRIREKLFWYPLILMLCFYAGENMPEIHLFGFDLIPAQVFPGFVSATLFFIELTSINENLILLGYASLADYCEKLRDFIFGRLKA